MSEAKGERPERKETPADIRRAQRWFLTSRQRLALGFDDIHVSKLPAMASRQSSVCLCLEKLEGWSIPLQLLEAVDRGECSLAVQISLSLFHLASRTFFGTTWMGAPTALSGDDGDHIPDILDVNYNEIVYFVSRIFDPACVGVLEIVVSKRDKDQNLVMSQHG